MRNYKKKPWSKQERLLLVNNYYLVTKQNLYAILPDRTPNAITKQVAYLKAKRWPFKRESKS